MVGSPRGALIGFPWLIPGGIPWGGSWGCQLRAVPDVGGIKALVEQHLLRIRTLYRLGVPWGTLCTLCDDDEVRTHAHQQLGDSWGVPWGVPWGILWGGFSGGIPGGDPLGDPLRGPSKFFLFFETDEKHRIESTLWDPLGGSPGGILWVDTWGDTQRTPQKTPQAPV